MILRGFVDTAKYVGLLLSKVINSVIGKSPAKIMGEIQSLIKFFKIFKIFENS